MPCELPRNDNDELLLLIRCQEIVLFSYNMPKETFMLLFFTHISPKHGILKPIVVLYPLIFPRFQGLDPFSSIHLPKLDYCSLGGQIGLRNDFKDQYVPNNMDIQGHYCCSLHHTSHRHGFTSLVSTNSAQNKLKVISDFLDIIFYY